MRMYVYIVWDKSIRAVVGVFRERPSALEYARQYCIDFDLFYEVVNP